MSFNFTLFFYCKKESLDSIGDIPPRDPSRLKGEKGGLGLLPGDKM